MCVEVNGGTAIRFKKKILMGERGDGKGDKLRVSVNY